MNEKNIEKRAEELGFEKMKFMKTEDLKFVPDFRKFCEQNDCGNYGKNYACPPVCGTPEAMEAKVKQYENALVFQSRTPVNNIFDDAETKAIKKIHTRKTLKAVEELKKGGLPEDGTFIMCGPCNFCDVCKMAEGEACVKENMRFSCLSAYCIDAMKMAEHCQMDMEWNGSEVSFFSLYLFK
ncbi:MAG: DUF2284 domain-containing protein [Blautia sp.]